MMAPLGVDGELASNQLLAGLQINETDVVLRAGHADVHECLVKPRPMMQLGEQYVL